MYYDTHVLPVSTYYAGMVMKSFNCCVGFVTLSPGLSQVCIGQDLVLTCATNQTAKVWNFVPPLSNHLGVPIPQDWFISFSDQSQQSQTLIVNSTKFTIERTSGMNSFPLVSTMTVVNSSSALNMATVSCTNIINSRHGMSALATIIVVGDTHTGLDARLL